MNRTNNGANTDVGKILMDILAVVASYLIILIIDLFSGAGVDAWKMTPVIVIFGAIYIVSNSAQSVYDVTVFFYLDRVFRKILTSYTFSFAVTFSLIYLSQNPELNKNTYYVFLFVSLLLFALFAYIHRRYSDRFGKRGIPRVALVGKKGEFNKFNYFLQKTNIRYKLIGYIAYTKETYDEEYIGYLDNLEELIREHQIDQIYFMDGHDVPLSLVQKYIDLCIGMGVTMRVIVNTFKRRRCNSYVSTVGTYPIVTYHTVTLNRSEEIIKRVMDIVGGLFGIILSSPIMIITAIAIKIDSPGPVFFKQTRVGKNGRLFKMYKFRSMCNNADAMKKQLMEQNEVKDGAMFKMKNDPRVTKVGRFIRKTSIDELPQFFNIVGGSMSLVGTRPPTLDEVEQYDATQWRRISIKPGLTGMWQVSGRSKITDFDEVVKLDTQYIDNWSIFLDIEILFQTVLSVFKRDGAY